jgi:hypothetical protein
VAVGTNEYAAEVPNELWAVPGAYSLRVVLQGHIPSIRLKRKLFGLFSRLLWLISSNSKS